VKRREVLIGLTATAAIGAAGGAAAALPERFYTGPIEFHLPAAPYPGFYVHAWTANGYWPDGRIETFHGGARHDRFAETEQQFRRDMMSVVDQGWRPFPAILVQAV